MANATEQNTTFRNEDADSEDIGTFKWSLLSHRSNADPKM